MKKLFTLLTALILLFSITACTVTENNSSEPPASSETPTSSDAPASSDVTSSEPPASSVVTPSNLPFVPETEMGELGRSIWDFRLQALWQGDMFFYLKNNRIYSYNMSTKQVNLIYSNENSVIREMVFHDGWIYFSEFETQKNTSDYQTFNRISKIKADGSEYERIITELPTGGDMAASQMFMHNGLLNFNVYFGATVFYKATLDGEIVSEIRGIPFAFVGNGWFNDNDVITNGSEIVSDDILPDKSYTIYNDKIFTYSYDHAAGKGKLTYYDIRNPENKTEIILGKTEEYPSLFEYCVIGNWIFYINADGEICKMDIEGNGYEVLATKKVSRFAVCGEWILYYTTDNDVAIIKYDGTENKIIQ